MGSILILIIYLNSCVSFWKKIDGRVKRAYLGLYLLMQRLLSYSIDVMLLNLIYAILLFHIYFVVLLESHQSLLFIFAEAIGDSGSSEGRS